MAHEHEYEIDGPLIEEVFRLTATDERTPLPRHRHNLTRSQVETTQRARIIVATAEVVNELGYAAASSKAIIERAGVSSKTFYALFGDKESAFFAAFSLLDGVIVDVVRGAPHPEDPRRQAREGIEGFLEQLAAVPLFTRLRIVEAPAAGHRALERQRAITREFARAIHRLMGPAQERDPRIRMLSEEILVMFCGGVAELMLEHILEHGTASLPDLSPTVYEMLELLAFAPE
ncbi:MAG: TetR/AcrR family transcriptional regulator [Solirubrobacteraceae bacterium]|nr:TetR/AcrR family transcriptional regulator [Solirubrobacteraceae bacterium]